jgi:aspartyl-tRNA(Asn)/glutamyl-tRNA(Gln) amidotransferase subunit A
MAPKTVPLHDLTGAQLTRRYRFGALSPVDVARHALARADQFTSDIRAFSHRDDQQALAMARASETRWAAGKPLSRWDGIPVTIKGNVAVKGWPFTRGSMLVDETPLDFDAPATQRLKEAGCVILGQTAMPEFGWKGLGDSPRHGAVSNPWDHSRSPGGSSAGAAACAALGIGVFHIGTDGLGSIRIPASFTGVAGLKPSFGRVAAFPASPMGVIAKLGPMARKVADVAALLEIMARTDTIDPYSSPEQAPKAARSSLNYPEPGKVSREVPGVRTQGQAPRFAWSPTLGFAKGLDPEVEAICAAAVTKLAKAGFVVEAADPGISDPIDTANAYWHAGSALVLGGLPKARWGELDPGFLRGAMTGLALPAARLSQAGPERAALHNIMRGFHAKHDFLLTPTMPIPALKLGADTPADGSFGDDWTNWSPYTYPFNITGQPAGSVPVGLTKAGLPVGLQIVGKLGDDANVLRAMATVEALAGFEGWGRLG